MVRAIGFVWVMVVFGFFWAAVVAAAQTRWMDAIGFAVVWVVVGGTPLVIGAALHREPPEPVLRRPWTDEELDQFLHGSDDAY